MKQRIQNFLLKLFYGIPRQGEPINLESPIKEKKEYIRERADYPPGFNEWRTHIDRLTLN